MEVLGVILIDSEIEGVIEIDGVIDGVMLIEGVILDDSEIDGVIDGVSLIVGVIEGVIDGLNPSVTLTVLDTLGVTEIEIDFVWLTVGVTGPVALTEGVTLMLTWVPLMLGVMLMLLLTEGVTLGVAASLRHP